MSSHYFVGSQADNLSTWTLIIHAQLSHCDRPRRKLPSMSVSVEIRLGKSHLRGDQYRLHLPAIIISQLRPRPSHRLVYILISDCLATASIKPTVHEQLNLQAVHTCVGTPPVRPRVEGRCFQGGCERCWVGCYTGALSDVV